MQLENNIRITAVLDIMATLRNRFDILESENQKLKSSVGELIASSSKTNTASWSYQSPITAMYLVAVESVYRPGLSPVHPAVLHDYMNYVRAYAYGWIRRGLSTHCKFLRVPLFLIISRLSLLSTSIMSNYFVYFAFMYYVCK